MKHIHTFENFLNESNVRFLNFKGALSSAGIELQWMDEIKSVPQSVIDMIEHFGNTHYRDICVVFERDVENFSAVRTLSAKFGVLTLFGEDPKSGQFAVINTKR